MVEQDHKFAGIDWLDDIRVRAGFQASRLRRGAGIRREYDDGCVLIDECASLFFGVFG